MRDKKIRIEEPFDGTNTARAVYMIDKFLKIKYTFKHVAKILKLCEEAGADLYTLLEHDIKPALAEIEVCFLYTTYVFVK